MEISFGKPENASPAPVIEVPTTVTQETQTAPETAPGVGVTALTAPMPISATSKLIGDKLPEFKDIILPRLNISQAIGELNKTFVPGTLVFNQQVPLFTPPDIDKDGNLKRAATPPVVLTVLGFRPTRFVEKVPGGGRGLIVDTEDAVRANGGTLDFNEAKLKAASGMKYFQPLADAVVVVERPEHCKDDGTVFVYEVEGKKYALGLWSLKGTSYTAAAKRVFFTARACGCLHQGGYPSWSYNVTTRLEKYPGNNQAWVPICLPRQKNSDEFLNFVRSILG